METIPLVIENISPILRVSDMAASRHFYIDILGLTEAEWGSDEFTCVSSGNLGIYLCRGSQGCKGTWLWMGFDGDIFVLQQYLINNGVKIIQPPVNYSWSLELSIEDPDGHVIRMGTEPDSSIPFADKRN